jgi:hypothetical protein
MPGKAALAEQLCDVVERRLLDPLEILLEAGDVLAVTRGQVADRANRWAEDMLADDEQRAMHTIVRLIAALYPSDGPFDPPTEWWGTPLGQVVVRRAGHPFAQAVPYSVAGAMLGVTRQFVHNLVIRGKLERHPDGGVTIASVQARLALQQPGDRSVEVAPPPDVPPRAGERP